MIRLPLALLLASLAAACHAVESTFDTNNEGWQTCNVGIPPSDPGIDDFAPAGWTGTDGVPAGSLLTQDVANFCFFAAPTKFLGDQSGMFGGTLSFDTFAPSSDGAPYPAAILRSGSTLLYNTSLPPGPTWTHTAISLQGSSWSLSPDAGAVGVDNAYFSNFLGHLDGLYIEADWYFGVGAADTTGLDNVRLTSAPEPGSLVALGMGALVVAGRRRKLRTRQQ